jgi:hypothetical protein
MHLSGAQLRRSVLVQFIPQVYGRIFMAQNARVESSQRAHGCKLRVR